MKNRKKILNLNNHHKKTTKSEDNNNRKKKFQKKIKTKNKINKASQEKGKVKYKINKSLNIFPPNLKNKKDKPIMKFIEISEFLKTHPNNNIFTKQLISPRRKITFNTFNYKNLKLSIQRKKTTKINKIFINNNKIIKINKLTQSIKLKKPKRKIRSTSNNSKKNNFKKLFNKIKEQSIKNNINTINKKNNIIHHHIMNITNLTQKNYFSNIIINNFKGTEKKKVNSPYKNRSKFEISLISLHKIDKNINSKNNLNQIKRRLYKNSKLFNNFKKKIIKDDNILKSSIKNNSKNIMNITDEEGNNQKRNIVNSKILKKSKEKENEIKTIPITMNNNKKQKYKIKVSFINNCNKGNNKNLFLNTEYSIKNRSKNRVKYLEKRDLNFKNTTQNEKRFKILLTDINYDEEANRNKIANIVSAENSHRNKNSSINKKNSLEKNKINNSKTNSHWNPPWKKKLKKFKKLSNSKKFSILNIKDVAEINSSIVKTEGNSIKYQTQIDSQRNKPNVVNSKKNLSTYFNLNSARNHDKKIINNSYNMGNNQYLRNLIENNPFLKLKILKLCKIKTNINNNIRNKKTINIDHNKNIKNNFIINYANDTIKKHSSKNKTVLNSNMDMNSLIINKKFKNNNNNKNLYYDKFLASKKLMVSLKKKTNIKSKLINNLFEKKVNNKSKKNSVKNNGYDNKNKINNSAIINFPNNIKKVKFYNNFTDNNKIGNKVGFAKNNEFSRLKTELFNSLYAKKIKHKKIKSMKDALKSVKINKNSKQFNNLLLNN